MKKCKQKTNCTCGQKANLKGTLVGKKTHCVCLGMPLLWQSI